MRIEIIQKAVPFFLKFNRTYVRIKLNKNVCSLRSELNGADHKRIWMENGKRVRR